MTSGDTSESRVRVGLLAGGSVAAVGVAQDGVAAGADHDRVHRLVDRGPHCPSHEILEGVVHVTGQVDDPAVVRIGRQRSHCSVGPHGASRGRRYPCRRGLAGCRHGEEPLERLGLGGTRRDRSCLGLASVLHGASQLALRLAQQFVGLGRAPAPSRASTASPRHAARRSGWRAPAPGLHQLAAGLLARRVGVRDPLRRVAGSPVGGPRRPRRAPWRSSSVASARAWPEDLRCLRFEARTCIVVGGHDPTLPAPSTRTAVLSPASSRWFGTGRAAVGSAGMQEILDAIVSGASGDDIAALAIPESYRAAFVTRDEQTMFEGLDSADKDPRKSLHVDDVATPELAPDEAYIAVMASSINFNTVWTSIFEPLPTFVFLDRLGKESQVGRPPRPAVPRRRLRRVGRRAEGRRRRAQLEAGRPGHGPLQLRRRPGSVGARRLDARGEPAHLGLRDELRRPRRPRGRQGQPAHAEARAPHVGRGGVQRAVQLDLVPHARVAQRRRHEAGRHRLRLGRDRRPRRLRGAVRAQRRRHPGRRRVARRRRSSCCTTSDATRSSTARRPTTSSGTTSTPRTRREWRRLGKDIRALVGEDPEHRVRAPRPPDHGRVGVRVRPRRHRRDVRGDVGLHDRVRQPAPLDEAEVDQVVALRQLPRGVGRQPADRQGHDPADPVGRAPADRTWARPPTRSTRTCTRARSACCASRPRRASASTTPRSARRSARTRSPCSGGTTHEASKAHTMSPLTARNPNEDKAERERGVRPDGLAADRDRPRRDRRARPRRGHRLLPRDVRRARRPPRGRRLRRRRRGAAEGGRLVHPAADADP